jgi:hypothetical protein
MKDAKERLAIGLQRLVSDVWDKKDVGKKIITYNSGDSLVVTHLTTNPPVQCLSTAERTGSSVFIVLWSYVEETVTVSVHDLVFACGTE